MFSGAGTEQGAVKCSPTVKTVHRVGATKKPQSTQLSCHTPGLFLKVSTMDIDPQTRNS